MSANRPDPVLLIGLDVAEVSLIEKGMSDGSLPNLARLRSQGSFGRLDSPADCWWVRHGPAFPPRTGRATTASSTTGNGAQA